MTTPAFKACLNNWSADVLKEFAKLLEVYQKTHTRKQGFLIPLK